MTKARWVRLVAGLFVLSLVVAACSSDDGGGTTRATGTTATGSTGGGGTTITIAGFAFEPNTITVSGPTEITIVNGDFRAHTFTLDEQLGRDYRAEGSVTVTVDVSETTGFVCRVHPEMTGTIEVA